jgi:ornithine decarboxylase
MYYINDGVYGSFNCVLYDHAVVTPQPLKVSFVLVSEKKQRQHN